MGTQSELLKPIVWFIEASISTSNGSWILFKEKRNCQLPFSLCNFRIILGHSFPFLISQVSISNVLLDLISVSSFLGIIYSLNRQHN